MTLDRVIANSANLIGDKSRASILVSLMEGKALTAGELAMRANISPQTASNHLKKLMDANLIVHVITTTRYRYYKIASPLVAAALESLSLLSETPKKNTPVHKGLDKELCFARTCYDHLAGELGVKITNCLLSKDFINEKNEDFLVTASGNTFFKSLDIDCNKLTKLRRQLAKPCLDWTERKYHLAGSLGSALLDYFIHHRLVIQSNTKPRVVILTTKGQLWLRNELEVTEIINLKKNN